MPKMSKEAILEAYEHYKREDLTIGGVAEFYPVHKDTLGRYFKREGLKIKPNGTSHRVLSDEQIVEAYLLYSSGEMNFYELGEKYGVSRKCMSANIKKRFPDVDTGRYSCDESVFENLDSEETYYWIGFLAADGCVYDRGYGQKRLQIRLKSTDKGHLEKLKFFLKSDHALNTYSFPSRTGSGDITSCDLHIQSDRLCNDLEGYGIVARKSGTFRVSDAIAKNPHFWRGVIDGDGYICKSDRKVSLYNTSKEFIEQYFEWINSVCEFEGRISSRKRKKRWARCYSLNVCGENSSKVLEILYGGSNVHLERKYKAAIKWFDKID